MAGLLGQLLLCIFCLSYLAEQCVGEYQEPHSNQMMFKLIIRGGEQSCYFQDIHNESTVFLHYQVQGVRGGGEYEVSAYVQKVGVQDYLYAGEWNQTGHYWQEGVPPGTYAFCINNEQSYWEKAVNVFIGYRRNSEWTNAGPYDDQPINGTDTDDFGSLPEMLASIENVEKNVFGMGFQQKIWRRHLSLDMDIALGLNSFILFNSVIFMTIVVITALVQMFFTKRLFDTPKYSGSIKQPT